MSENQEITSSGGFMNVATLEQALKCSEYIAKSSFCPKAFMGKAGDVLICLQMGQELGLKPMQALQNIAVINGKPSLWGDAMLAVCRQSPEFEFIKETYDEKTKSCTCIVKRRDEPEFVSTFSEADAKLAQLWGKQGPWSQYPKRMLQMRARGFCLRDSFPDLLRGIISSEEAGDTSPERNDYSNVNTTVVEGQAEHVALISDEQLNLLRQKMAETKTNEIDVCAYLKIAALELMPIENYPTVLQQLEKKLAKKQIEKTVDPEIDEWLAEAGEVESVSQADEVAQML